MDSTKLIYTIQLKIDSVKTVLLSVSNEDISYSTVSILFKIFIFKQLLLINISTS